MITIDETRRKKKKADFKIAKIDPEFDGILKDWVNQGYFKSKTEATRNLKPIIEPLTWNRVPMKINSVGKINKVKLIKSKSKRRKIALELGNI